MDDHVAVGTVVSRDRCGHTQHRLLERAEIGTGHIRAVPRRSGVEVRDLVAVPLPLRIHDDRSAPVHDPDLRLQERCHSLQLRIGVGQLYVVALIHGGIGGSDQAGLSVQRPAAGTRQITVSETRRKRRNGDETGDAEEKISEEEFQKQRKFDLHNPLFYIFLLPCAITSNLYPTPHTVVRDQLARSLIFSRRRLMCTSTVRVSPTYS